MTYSSLPPFAKLRIACLSYRGLSSYGLEPTLAMMFSQAEIVTIYPQHLRAHVLKNYDLLVMPGVVGEDSPYPEILPQYKADQILETMEASGLVLWTSCAATYYCFEKLVYLRRNGKTKTLAGLGIVKGVAEGPAYRHLTRDAFCQSAHRDRVLAELTLSDQAGIFRALDINGPSLYPHEDKLVDSFLRYSNVPNRPVAGFTKDVGRGMILGLSSHPEFSLRHPLLPEDFALHEPSRLSFLNIVRDKIAERWIKSGKLPAIIPACSRSPSHQLCTIQ